MPTFIDLEASSLGAASLRDEERSEFQALMHAYQDGLLRKAQALREAVRRGLAERAASRAPAASP